MTARLQRYGLIILTIYALLFVGGYDLMIPAVRYFNHVFLTVLGVGWLSWRWVKHQRGIPQTPLNIPIVALFILGVLTLPWSYDPRMSLEAIWGTLIFALAFWVIVNAFQQAQHRLILEIVFLIVAIMGFFGILQIGSVIFGWGILPNTSSGWIEFFGDGIPFPVERDLRIYVPLGGPTQVAGVLAPLIIILLTFILSTTRKAIRIIFSILLALTVLLLILTFSRGGLVAVMAGLFSLLGLRTILPRLQGSTTKITPFMKALFGFVVVTAIVIGLWIATIASQPGRRSGDNLRLDLWQSAIAMTVDNPVTGVGVDMYGRALREYRQVERPSDRLSAAHNIYLTTTAEYGLGALIILGLTVVIVGRQWWQRLSVLEVHSQEWQRVVGMMAALLAFCAHNLFDDITNFAGIALVAVMIVYCTMPLVKSRLDIAKTGNRALSASVIILLVGYCIWFVVSVDPAHRYYNASLVSDDPINQIEEAIRLDPYLSLYHLQETYLIGESAIANPTPENLTDAINRYEDAINSEVTWDIGMINLAALYELNGDLDTALHWLDQAREVNRNNTGHLHWARLAEQLNVASDDAIIEAYAYGMEYSGYLPLSDFWSETELRREALMVYMEDETLANQYRIARVHFPEQLDDLVSSDPQTGDEWWIDGERLLTIDNDPEQAINSFSTAIDIEPSNPDYYASRARAYSTIDREAALNDLRIARFLGRSETISEYPNIIQIDLTTTPEERERYQIQTLYVYGNSSFTGVLFNGRQARFAPYRPMRFIGRGDDYLQVSYDLAERYEASGEIEQAIQIYEAIAFITPETDRPLIEIQRLQASE